MSLPSVLEGHKHDRETQRHADRRRRLAKPIFYLAVCAFIAIPIVLKRVGLPEGPPGIALAVALLVVAGAVGLVAFLAGARMPRCSECGARFTARYFTPTHEDMARIRRSARGRVVREGRTVVEYVKIGQNRERRIVHQKKYGVCSECETYVIRG